MNLLCSFCFVIFQLAMFCASRCPPPCTCSSTIVNCENHGLTSVPSGIASTTTELLLRRNNISTIPSDAFESLTSLTYLDLSLNKISTIPPYAFKSTTSLRALSLSGNKISSISSNAFESLTLLTQLNLESNQISTIPTDVFNSLTSLQYLFLGYNKISTIPSDAFKPLTSLISLFLYKNKIFTISSDAFKSLTSIKNLHLNDNNISTIPSDAFVSVPSSLQVLHLHGNPLLCDCSIATIIKRLNSLGFCSDPVTGRKIFLKYLQPKDFCFNETNTSTTASTSTSISTSTSTSTSTSNSTLTTTATTTISLASTSNTETVPTYSPATLHPTDTLPTACPPVARIKLLGCFEHNVVRPVFIQHLNVRKLIDWSNLNATVDTCKYLVSKSKSKIFGVAFYGECWYDRSEVSLTKSTDCYGPVGKERSIMVYTFI